MSLQKHSLTEKQRLQKKADVVSGLSKKDIDGFINIGKKLAAKSVHYVLADLIREYAPAEEELAEQIEKMSPCNYCGYIQIEFKETPIKLNVCLSKVPNNYKASIYVPPGEYSQELYREYDTLKIAALAYFGAFINENKQLIKLLESKLGFKLDLTIDTENPTTMWFNRDSKHRIGIFPYYVDADGKPLQKDALEKK